MSSMCAGLEANYEIYDVSRGACRAWNQPGETDQMLHAGLETSHDKLIKCSVESAGHQVGQIDQMVCLGLETRQDKLIKCCV